MSNDKNNGENSENETAVVENEESSSDVEQEEIEELSHEEAIKQATEDEIDVNKGLFDSEAISNKKGILMGVGAVSALAIIVYSSLSTTQPDSVIISEPKSEQTTTLQAPLVASTKIGGKNLDNKEYLIAKKVTDKKGIQAALKNDLTYIPTPNTRTKLADEIKIEIKSPKKPQIEKPTSYLPSTPSLPQQSKNLDFGGNANYRRSNNPEDVHNQQMDLEFSDAINFDTSASYGLVASTSFADSVTSSDNRTGLSNDNQRNLVGFRQTAKNATQNPVEAPVQLVSPGDISMGYLSTAANSSVQTPVRAIIETGYFKGGVALGTFTQQGEWLVLKFTSVTKNNKTEQIEMYAVNITDKKSEQLVAVQGDVDNHYIRRFALPVIGSILTAYGTAFQNNGTTSDTSTTGAVSVTLNTTTVDAEKIAIAGLGQGISNIITSLGTIEPTVTIPAGEFIAVMATKAFFKKGTRNEL